MSRTSGTNLYQPLRIKIRVNTEERLNKNNVLLTLLAKAQIKYKSIIA